MLALSGMRGFHLLQLATRLYVSESPSTVIVIPHDAAVAPYAHDVNILIITPYSR